jgi:predicted nucleotide-binding protein (sugar kinase/HSP70/actin superfamily)
VVFSDATTEEMWVAGGKYGSIDPCFPSKVAQAHIHDLLFVQHKPDEGRPLRYIFFPSSLTCRPSGGRDGQDELPDRRGVPDVMKAAFTEGGRLLRPTRASSTLDPALTFAEMKPDRAGACSRPGSALGITEDESDHAHREAMRAIEPFERDCRRRARHPRDVEARTACAILMVGAPYHSDPGLNHGIPEEFQVLGTRSLGALDPEGDSRTFAATSRKRWRRGQHPLDINDVWPENYSANSAQKVWAVKFASRHPNVVLLDLSSFKCGHDAPTYGIIDSIVSSAATPYAALHDLDANKPGGSIKIRVKTYAYSLKLHTESLEDAARKKSELLHSLERKKLELLELKQRRRPAPDPELARQIAALAEKVRSYSPPATAAPANGNNEGNGLVTLKRKRGDGVLVPAQGGLS